MPIINIGSKLDARGFKQADTALGKLSGSSKRLGAALGAAFSGTAILAFGKASIKAFIQDEAAAARLTKAVENLGLGFEDARIKNFISDLEKTAAVSDDVLRPAFQSLLQTTGSVAKSQELLKLALDVSAGSGVDAIQVSKDLSLAYLGQTKGLSKYSLGLTKAELQTAGFNTIQDKLNDQFSGQNATRLDTYAGKMQVLGVAANNAKEIIGEGLVDAISALGDDSTVSNLAAQMESVATYTADVIRGIGVLIGYIKTVDGVISKIPGLNSVMDLTLRTNPLYDPIKLLNQMGKAASIKPKPFTVPMTISASTDSDVKVSAARKAAEEEARKRAAALLAVQKKTLKSQADALKISKAKAIFDLQKIQIAAALKGNLTDEERTRLLLMQAIENENIALIDKYTKMLTAAQAKAKELQDTLNGIKATTFGDPFAGWVSSAGNAQLAIAELSKSLMAVPSIIQANGREWSSFANLIANTNIQPNLKEWSSSFSPSATNPFIPPAAQAPAGGNTNISVTAPPFTDPEAIAKAIQDALQQSANNTGNRYGIGTGNKDVLYIV